MSRTAAPSSDVTTPMRRGSTGSSRLRAGVEQAVRLEPPLELVERGLQRAQPVRLERVDDELILALDLVHADASARDDAHPVLGRELQAQHARAEHHRANLRLVVLEREVDVAGAPLLAVGDLALDGDEAELRFDRGLDPGRELADREHRATPRAGGSSNGSSRHSLMTCGAAPRRAPAPPDPLPRDSAAESRRRGRSSRPRRRARRSCAGSPSPSRSAAAARS